MDDVIITRKQIDEVRNLYKRVCMDQSSKPFEHYDATEIQAIMSVCRILNIELD